MIHPATLYILVILCLACRHGFSQEQFEPVDRKQVEELVGDASTETFYPILLQRFNNFDTTLTLHDFRLLYFGFVFQPGYSAHPEENKKEISAEIEAEHYRRAMLMADSVLADNPVSLTANYLRGLAMFQNNENDSAYLHYINRYKRLRDAILSTGNGLTCKTAFSTIYVSDEYEIMYRYFEIDGNKSQSLQYPCDRFSIEPSRYFKNYEIFFDTSESMTALQKELNPSAK